MSNSGAGKDNAEWCILTFSTFWSSYRNFANIISPQIKYLYVLTAKLLYVLIIDIARSHMRLFIIF